MEDRDAPVKSLQSAMKMATEAIQLDGGNRHQEAYCQYLRTVAFVSQVLLQQAETEASQEHLAAVEVGRMLRLAEQCLERARSFVGTPSDPRPRTNQPQPSLSSQAAAAAPPPDVSTSPPDDVTAPPPDVATAPPPDVTTSPPDDVIAPPPDVTTSPPDDVIAPPPDVTTSPPDDVTALPPDEVTASPPGEVTAPPTGVPVPRFIPPEVFQRWQTVAWQDSGRKLLTPIEEASRLNQKLKANYEARLARLSPAQSYQKTSLTLSLQRQMMENLIIAKARQDALQRKMEERRLRLQEEANRRFSASGAVTAEEKEQRAVYTNVLEYEQDHDWPKVWKADLKKSPSDPGLVSGLVSYLLSRSDHPVVKLLKKHQFRIYNRLYPIVSQVPPRARGSLVAPDTPRSSVRSGGSGAQSLSSSSLSLSQDFCADVEKRLPAERDNSFEDLEEMLSQMDLDPDQDETLVSELESRALQEHLKSVVRDVHVAIDQLLSLCLLSFECLNTAPSKDLCLASIEEVFFTPLWGALLALFRKVHHERELACDAAMTLYCHASPVDLGVPAKLAPPDAGARPYECAVQELKQLVQDCCPQRKLDCIVRTLRLICACAEDYRALHESQSPHTTAAIGADDLLPILSFVVLRSGTPALVSECAALEEFIHEGVLIGEEGYCLTSLQSALTYVESLQGAARGRR
ncbi:VPS9 domain-containing protein 1 isoform X2 [Synchiropus splendidus]|uniref:VPS9 domain-containing protein 1 isoform X2 n=1 Tax=Synchiropus splendidus TaxID=270530 RepID=UPI00237DF56F|nr:VPS9 domain-containing protein 1 isoform X2 [Synchiropus splendidus]